MIKDNIHKLREEIASVCQKTGRNPQDITLIAITKNATYGQVKEAIEAGITDIGENRIQEAQEKLAEFKENPAITRHLVGHLQTNKIRLALDIFDLIHSVDSIRLARQIDKAAFGLAEKIDILVQVNVSAEKSKYGIEPGALDDFLKEALELEFVRVRGLMTIAPLTDNREEIRSCFRGLRLLKERLEKEGRFPGLGLDYLSMGMSNDYRIALEEGSNMLRIGRAIFEDAD